MLGCSVSGCQSPPELEAPSTAGLQDKVALHCHKVSTYYGYSHKVINALQNVCFILQLFVKWLTYRGM